MINAELFAQCAELVDALENARRIIHGGDGTLHIDTAEPVLRRAYALLAQLAPEAPVDGDVAELVDNCIVAYAEDLDIISSGRYMMIDDGRAKAALLQRLSAPTPPSEPIAYIHRQGNYWEPSERALQDDEKERGWTEEPLYAAPSLPKPLTDEAILDLAEEHEICYICLSGGVFYKFIEGTDMRDSLLSFARAIQELG